MFVYYIYLKTFFLKNKTFIFCKTIVKEIDIIFHNIL